MKRRIRKIFPVATVFVLGLGAGALILANHGWRCIGTVYYHWASHTVAYANPVEETADNNVVRNPANYTSAFGGAVGVWDTRTVITLGSGTDLRLYYDSYGATGWLGLATIFPSNCIIGRATSKLNDNYLRNTSRYSQTAIDHVACQEVGHTFGLGHNKKDANTCMNDKILTAGNQINQHDIDLLASIYAGL